MSRRIVSGLPPMLVRDVELVVEAALHWCEHVTRMIESDELDDAAALRAIAAGFGIELTAADARAYLGAAVLTTSEAVGRIASIATLARVLDAVEHPTNGGQG